MEEDDTINRSLSFEEEIAEAESIPKPAES